MAERNDERVEVVAEWLRAYATTFADASNRVSDYRDSARLLLALLDPAPTDQGANERLADYLAQHKDDLTGLIGNDGAAWYLIEKDTELIATIIADAADEIQTAIWRLRGGPMPATPPTDQGAEGLVRVSKGDLDALIRIAAGEEGREDLVPVALTREEAEELATGDNFHNPPRRRALEREGCPKCRAIIKLRHAVLLNPSE